jgi:serine/threonine-protein kinase
VLLGPVVVVAVIVGVVAGMLITDGGDALAAPQKPTVEVAAEAVDIKWPAVDGASEYVVKQDDSIIYVGDKTEYAQPVPLPGTYSYTVSARSADRDESPYSPASDEVAVAQRWHGLEKMATSFGEIVGPSPLSTDTFGQEACWGGTGSVDPKIPKTGVIFCRDAAATYTLQLRQFPTRQVRDEYLDSLNLKTSSVTTDQGADGTLYQGNAPTSDWAGTAILAFDGTDREVYDLTVTMDNGKDADAVALLDRLPL